MALLIIQTSDILITIHDIRLLTSLTHLAYAFRDVSIKTRLALLNKAFKFQNYTSYMTCMTNVSEYANDICIVRLVSLSCFA